MLNPHYSVMYLPIVYHEGRCFKNKYGFYRVFYVFLLYVFFLQNKFPAAWEIVVLGLRNISFSSSVSWIK